MKKDDYKIRLLFVLSISTYRPVIAWLCTVVVFAGVHVVCLLIARLGPTTETATYSSQAYTVVVPTLENCRPALRADKIYTDRRK